MPAINLTGSSYNLRSGADVQRLVGWMPVRVESGQGKGGAVAYLKAQPGLVKKATIAGPVRGFTVARGVLYAAGAEKFYRIDSDWETADLGTLGTARGITSMAVNNTQIAIVDGVTGSVFDLDTGTLAPLAGEAWQGSTRVELLDSYGIFIRPDSSQFYLTGIQDFTALDPLDFASAEGSTGNVVGMIVKHRELLLFKEYTGEAWYDAGNADFAFARNDGGIFEAGLSAPDTLQKLGGLCFWLGREANGAAVVYRMAGYAPERISTHSLEEKLSAFDDFSKAYAWTYQQEGLFFYVLQIPGLDTTWVYELGSGLWHERAEWVDGAYQPWRAQCHAFAYGVHVVGDKDGNIYVLDPTAGTNDGDVLIRDRITPHSARPTLNRVRFGSVQIDCTVGNGLGSNDAKLMLRYSDDGGHNWCNWRHLSLGKIGEFKARARCAMLGSARERVWQIRCTDNVPCDVISAVVDEV